MDKYIRGFYKSWREARSGVLAALQTAAATNPSYRVVVVGHSLGGAVRLPQEMIL